MGGQHAAPAACLPTAARSWRRRALAPTIRPPPICCLTASHIGVGDASREEEKAEAHAHDWLDWVQHSGVEAGCRGDGLREAGLGAVQRLQGCRPALLPSPLPPSPPQSRPQR